MKILNLFTLLILPFFVSVSASALLPSSERVHQTVILSSVKNCPKSEKEIAKEVLDLELAGMRYARSKPACFENLKMKYVHAAKNPDEAVTIFESVQSGSAKIESIQYDKKFYSYKVVFSIQNALGKRLKDSFSFMTNTNLGAKKPKTGCALISASPSKAYVLDSCL